MPTKIPWTDETWNVTAGCTKCSPGCKNCYAERMMYRQVCMGAARHEKNPDSNEDAWEAYSSVMDEDTHKWNGSVALRPEILDTPLHWRNPRRVFVDSMSDLFHPAVPFEFIDKVMFTIYRSYGLGHTYQILTKRPGRELEYFSGDVDMRILNLFRKLDPKKYITKSRLTDSIGTLLRVWFGVSICTPDELYKVETLRQIPAAVRFVSFEPLLTDMGELNLKGIDWVIIGCESGPKRRPCEYEWVRNIVEQCRAAGTPVFVKQVSIDGKVEHNINKFPSELQIREFPGG